MGGFEREPDGGVHVSKRSTWVSLGLVVTLLTAAMAGSWIAASTLWELRSEVAGLRQALDYSVDRTARALTIVDGQDAEIQRLKREVAVVQNRLDNLDRVRDRWNTGVSLQDER